jgi:hypothetical protein
MLGKLSTTVFLSRIFVLPGTNCGPIKAIEHICDSCVCHRSNGQGSGRSVDNHDHGQLSLGTMSKVMWFILCCMEMTELAFPRFCFV